MNLRNRIHILIGIISIGLLPSARAVVPPPDGGYPGFNTAEGQNALFSLSTGSANTAVGWFSLFSDTTGSFNTATGAGALLFSTGDQNTAFGAAALLFNTIGSSNTAVGAATLLNNTEGNFNTATGAAALLNNTTGFSNTANGVRALFSNTGGDDNTATGLEVLVSNTVGFSNTANGRQALFSNTEGDYNTAAGTVALSSNTTGSNNTAIGALALSNNATGANNTALGSEAGESITASGNVCIGQGVSGEAGAINTTWIRNVNTLTQNFSAGVNDYVTVRLSDGRLGHTAVVSSHRYKQDIKPLAAVSQALYALKPVSFRLKKEFDPTQALGFGLIAEEVEKVDPALVYRNDKGQVESVRYEMVNAMLLNEFLKEHRKVEEQQKRIDVPAAQLKEQAAQIQKVSAQLAAASPSGGGLEASKPAPQVARNNQ
jgi:hypothetical protein